MQKNTYSITLLSGSDSFKIGDQAAGFTVEDFWRFQFSNVWEMQDEVAEFIVAKALGQDLPHNKNGWTLWDITYKGKKIEVKTSAYYHSWRSDGKVSEQRTFSITKAYTRYKDPTSEFKRQNDIYVFCLNTGTTQESSNPLVLDNWRFFVIPTATINLLCKNNKTISLKRVAKISKTPNGVSFAGLKSAVDDALCSLSDSE